MDVNSLQVVLNDIEQAFHFVWACVYVVLGVLAWRAFL